MLRWAYLGYSSRVLNIFKLTLVITTSGHFVACAFYMIARVERHSDDNWTHRDGLYNQGEDYLGCMVEEGAVEAVCEVQHTRYVTNESHYVHYVSALYFAYTTLTTVGYGDINATTMGERIIALGALIIGSAVFAGVVGTMTQMMESMDEIEASKLKKIKQLQYFIKSHHFPDAIRLRLRRFYDLHFQQFKKELGMLRELPPSLRNECYAHIYSEEIKAVPFLKNASR